MPGSPAFCLDVQDVRQVRMRGHGCFPATILAQPRRPCRPRHPYAVPRTSLQCVCTRRRNCIAQLSPSREYALRTVDFPARNSATIELTHCPHGSGSRRRITFATRLQRTQSEQIVFRVTPVAIRAAPLPSVSQAIASEGFAFLFSKVRPPLDRFPNPSEIRDSPKSWR
jgi:hypothetical protein